MVLPEARSGRGLPYNDVPGGCAMCCTSESRKRILVQLSLAVREAERSNSQQAGQSFTGLIRESDMAF